MTDPRRPLPGRRDAERLLDARGRHGRRPDTGDTRVTDELGRLLAEAAAPPLILDPFREHEALRHFRGAVRQPAPAPAPRTVRQRVAALSATAKVLSLAVGAATATGGVALASTAMPLPLTHGLRSPASESRDEPTVPAVHDSGDATPGIDPATVPVTATGLPAAQESAANGGSRSRTDRRGAGVVPGLPFPIGTMPVGGGDEGPSGGSGGSGGGSGATTQPSIPVSVPTTDPGTPTSAPTTTPPPHQTRGPGWEAPSEDPTDGATTPPPEEISTEEPTPTE